MRVPKLAAGVFFLHFLKKVFLQFHHQCKKILPLFFLRHHFMRWTSNNPVPFAVIFKDFPFLFHFFFPTLLYCQLKQTVSLLSCSSSRCCCATHCHFFFFFFCFFGGWTIVSSHPFCVWAELVFGKGWASSYSDVLATTDFSSFLSCTTPMLCTL